MARLPSGPRLAAAALLLGIAGVLAAPVALSAPAPQAHGETSHAGSGDHAEEHHGTPWLAVFTNFAIFAGVLIYFFRSPARAFFSERKAGIAHSLAAAEKARADAEAKLTEARALLDEVGQQADEILARATEQAEAERAAVLAAARDEADRIGQQAEARIAELESSATRRLRTIAADLAVDLARGLVEEKIAPADRARLLERNLDSLRETAS